ncbi:MAG: DUF2069 domain-containing protein [Betaproteobacteria bacterium]|nr:MAG: DUF2069 domain-containing protein [Betaproteobacteria bacterium]
MTLRVQTLQTLSAALLIALIFLCVAWELWLAPLRPEGSWLVLKALPLLAPLFGILHGRRYSYKVMSLLIWLYVMEGSMRLYVETGLAQHLASAELILALGLFTSTALYLRHSRPRG